LFKGDEKMDNMIVDVSYAAMGNSSKYMNGATSTAKGMTVMGTVWISDLKTIGALLQDVSGSFWFCNSYYMRELPLREVARAITRDVR
jgi:hypothetical protein